MAISRAPKGTVMGIFAAIAACIGFASAAVAQPAPQPKPAPAPASGPSDMSYAVETFAYPNAAQILKEQGITLYTGDGHIMLTNCSAAHDITVKARDAGKDFCFAVTGKKGYLSLNLPGAYGIWTQDYAVTATITSDGKDTVVNAPKNTYTGFGEGDQQKHAPSVLVTLRANG
ncbi:hypothetical protein [Streptomyces orinoci]|uniref:Secreted protein n=1 Tax=Streptomyces orinoci TaxID=67339 RepID=A0ABV3K6E2_STRON|nr:hypothetical protein [Streptomyces orinoci]